MPGCVLVRGAFALKIPPPAGGMHSGLPNAPAGFFAVWRRTYLPDFCGLEAYPPAGRMQV